MGEMSAGELGKHFDISGPSRSHHLSKLEATDLVIVNRMCQRINYSINTSFFDDAAQFVIGFFQEKTEIEKKSILLMH